ncbi:VIT1/CCC1 transporter family protein [Helcobacillus massiliensis]|uniref:VIT1/CCC1 transporter family protein n=1 Tax=Helcobacillus massiliensis TaxID=521392 RepID=UPI0025548688|nr:VIT family protein [Helcobacillus massiliensis]MDK7741279.1 VIT family protein [Helcobacillus massiliensis]WOO92868.1 VIT family protein [Helcobacillus massiliensis]
MNASSSTLQSSQSPLASASHDPAAGTTAAPERAVPSASRLNQLRAGVLGANDGIVSVAGMVVGVAAATPHFGPLAVASAAAVGAGSLSMAMGEYVSVSAQKDSESATIARTRAALAEDPDGQLEHLSASLEEAGIPADLARESAVRMTAHDALDAHMRMRYSIDEDEIASPMHAAIWSFVAFLLGGLLPVLAVLLVPVPFKIPATFAAVVLALAFTGMIAARLGQAAAGKATLRTIAGGVLAMAVTYGIGALVGVAV